LQNVSLLSLLAVSEALDHHPQLLTQSNPIQRNMRDGCSTPSCCLMLELQLLKFF